MMFEQMPAEERARARTKFFSKNEYSEMFAKLPRVLEIYDTIESRTTQQVAMMHVHAAFLLVNQTNYMTLTAALSGTESLAKGITTQTVKYLLMSQDLDIGHMAALVQAITADGMDIVKRMEL